MDGCLPRSIENNGLTDLPPSIPYASLSDLSDLALVRLDESKLRKSHVVAQGAYGEVWYGEYKRMTIVMTRGAVNVAWVGDPVAVNWATPAALEMVVEWMDRGDLKQVLDQTKPPTDPSTAFP
ncbi:hypothetical protein DYB32_010565 [Aphanomyces invadans]|uniref:Protein kinase domain-containing protein n=1 Tax=Aphanomyces invadans TaxID=157072 RepID=A0A418AFP0_9STRA|nr:hypothetical protein DYB32_010565 [Aphanomyces invadans]